MNSIAKRSHNFAFYIMIFKSLCLSVSSVAKIAKKMSKNHCTNLTKNMQNEPNWKIDPMPVTISLIRHYSSWTLGVVGKTNPNEPNFFKFLPLFNFFWTIYYCISNPIKYNTARNRLFKKHRFAKGLQQ